MPDTRAIFITFYKLWLIVKIFFRNLAIFILAMIGKYAPLFILTIILGETYKGYFTDNLRFIWMITYVTDKHNKLKQYYPDEDTIKIALYNDDVAKIYIIYLKENKYEIECWHLQNKKGSYKFLEGRFRLNTIVLD